MRRCTSSSRARSSTRSPDRRSEVRAGAGHRLRDRDARARRGRSTPARRRSAASIATRGRSRKRTGPTGSSAWPAGPRSATSAARRFEGRPGTAAIVAYTANELDRRGRATLLEQLLGAARPAARRVLVIEPIARSDDAVVAGLGSASSCPSGGRADEWRFPAVAAAATAGAGARRRPGSARADRAEPVSCRPSLPGGLTGPR